MARDPVPVRGNRVTYCQLCILSEWVTFSCVIKKETQIKLYNAVDGMERNRQPTGKQQQQSLDIQSFSHPEMNGRQYLMCHVECEEHQMKQQYNPSYLAEPADVKTLCLIKAFLHVFPDSNFTIFLEFYITVPIINYLAIEQYVRLMVKQS